MAGRGAVCGGAAGIGGAIVSKITWGPIIPHNGSPDCPADARDVPCMIDHQSTGWIGGLGLVKGGEWIDAWRNVTFYCIPLPTPDVTADLVAAV